MSPGTRLQHMRPPRLSAGVIAVLLTLTGCGPGKLLDPPHQFAPDPISTAPARTMSFVLREPGSVTLRIYDTAGAVVWTFTVSLGTGIHEFRWDGLTDAGLPAGCGVYMYVIQFSDGTRATGRLVLVH